ncbi:MAG: glycosyltransferase [Desulfosoma sp.]|uniref:glycosyltransferase n=1 Tax=Desulfosoma sp. TaxID=2603217 RepID=UPI00404AF76B
MDYSSALELVKALARDVKAGHLWALRDAAAHRRRRQDLWMALNALLVWHRPKLEAEAGLDYPYKVLREKGAIFAGFASGSQDPFVRHQAELYLALLPFPGQWRRLSTLEAAANKDAEVVDFVRQEEAKIAEKISEKPEKTVHIRHFMQVLKSPQDPHEKGVLRLFALPYLLARAPLLEALTRRFVLFVEPPMGIVWRHSWWRRFCSGEDPCLFGLSGSEDRQFIATQHHALALPLAHGDFLEDLNKPPCTKEPKAFDLVFNATFDDMGRKRHLFMLDLLTHQELSGKTALFLGRGRPENVQAFRRAVTQRGLASRVTVRPNVPRREVPALLSQCRLGVHLSLYENACRAVMEFFRSNVPCVVSASMAGINLEMFTHETGAAVPDGRLVQTIAEVLENAHQYAPRRWFLRESGSLVSTRRLNEALKTLFLEWGLAWTEDIVTLTSSGASRYGSRDDEKRFHEEHLWIAQRLQHALPFGFQVLP